VWIEPWVGVKTSPQEGEDGRANARRVFPETRDGGGAQGVRVALDEPVAASMARDDLELVRKNPVTPYR
jgi:hypothetical protein